MGGADHVLLAADRSMVHVNSSRMDTRHEFEGVHVMPVTVADLKLNWLLILRVVANHVSPFLCLRILTVSIRMDNRKSFYYPWYPQLVLRPFVGYVG